MAGELAKYKRIVGRINKLSEKMQELKDGDFVAKTALLKMRLSSGEGLASLLPEAYALVREAAERAIGLRAFDVQLIGAVAANEQNIVEMKTGEGKTLTIIFPAYLNALAGKGVHVVTANDYLAERDALWMGKVFRFLGMSAHAITQKSSDFDRQVAYAADVTYVTNNEVCFDYLKDNMLIDQANRRQRGLSFAIVDEADSVLIDEAQNPLIISENQEKDGEESRMFERINRMVLALKEGVDYQMDSKEKTVNITPGGIKKLEILLGIENLYAEDNQQDYLYFVERLIKAHVLFRRDRDYIVEDGKVIIVDEFTGRLMPEHRYYHGLHQAIEAKEGVGAKGENETLASITFQHFFKRYEKLTGFTGTAKESEKEFMMIYNKPVFVVPTNKPVQREDLPDRFFATWQDKLNYITWSTQEHYFKDRAVLIGTRSVRRSMLVQKSLLEENIPSSVLNAKHTKREAEIIAQAGNPQAITVATNMAGRGTDIELDEGVREHGGLWVFGTERHNTKRIDEQLIGRSGRQGDPGHSQFLISSEDELITTYYKKEYDREIAKYDNLEKGIENKKLSSILAKAQRRVEDMFFSQRLLSYEFDKVLDAQRQSFYRQRQRVLDDHNLKDETLNLIKNECYRELMSIKKLPDEFFEKDDLDKVVVKIKGLMGNRWFKLSFSPKKFHLVAEVIQEIHKSLEDFYHDAETYLTMEKMRELEKVATLKALDVMWARHLKEVEDFQEAAVISSIGRGDFFEEYEIRMAAKYRNFLYSLPSVVARTVLRTMNRVWGDN